VREARPGDDTIVATASRDIRGPGQLAWQTHPSLLVLLGPASYFGAFAMQSFFASAAACIAFFRTCPVGAFGALAAFAAAS
jgi:hypothetical protein